MATWTWKEFKPTISSIPQPEMSRIDTLSTLQVERLRRGISQKKFAERLGMTQSQLARIENLDIVPDSEILDRYAAGLEL
jgi:predicted transcriptional regulator